MRRFPVMGFNVMFTRAFEGNAVAALMRVMVICRRSADHAYDDAPQTVPGSTSTSGAIGRLNVKDTENSQLWTLNCMSPAQAARSSTLPTP